MGRSARSTADLCPHLREDYGAIGETRLVDFHLQPLLTALLAVRVAGPDLRAVVRRLLGRAVRVGTEQILSQAREER